MPIGELSFWVKIDKQSLGKATADIKDEFNATGQKLETWFSSTFNKIAKLAVWATLWAWIAKLWSWILNLAWNLEQAEVSFTTMLWSVEKAKAFLNELSDFAQKTPFELVWLRQTAKQLIAFWIDAQDVIPTLKSLWDVASWLSVPIEQIAYAYWQVKVAWRLMWQDLMQFTNAWVPLIAELSKNLWISQSKIKWMVSEWKIWFEDVKKAFETMSWEWWKFFNLMEKQSTTFKWSISNLTDGLNSLWETIGSALLPQLNPIIQKISSIVWEIKNWTQENKTLIGYISWSFLNLILDAIWSIWKWFIEIGNLIFGIIDSIFSLFTDQIINSWNKADNFWKQVLRAFFLVTQWVQLVVNSIKYLWEIIWLTLFAWHTSVIAFGKSFYYIFEGTLKSVTRLFEVLADNIVIWIQKWLNGWIDILNSFIKKTNEIAWTNFWTFVWFWENKKFKSFDWIAESLSTWWSQAWNEIKSTLDIIKNEWKNTTSDIWKSWDNFVLWLGKWLNEIETKNITTKNKIDLAYSKKTQNNFLDDNKEKTKKNKEETEQLTYELDKVKDKYKEWNSANEEMKTKIKGYNSDVKQYYTDIQDWIVKVIDKQKELNESYKKNKLSSEKDFIRSSLEDEKNKNEDINSIKKDILDSEKELLSIQTDISDKNSEIQNDNQLNLENISVKEKELAILKQKQLELSKETNESQKMSLILSIQKKEKELELLRSWKSIDILDLQEKELTQKQKLIELNDKLIIKQKELKNISENINWIGASQSIIDEERTRANMTEAERKKYDYQLQKIQNEEQYKADLEKLERQKKIYDFFQNWEFSISQLQKLLADEKLKLYSTEEQEIIKTLANKRIALETEKQDIIQQQIDINDKTRQLSNDTTILQLKNIKILKQEYIDLINQISNAVKSQQQLIQLKSSEQWFMAWGYTWNWAINEIAWVVHGQEYVVNNQMLKNAPGLFNALESLRTWGNYDYSKKISTWNIVVNNQIDLENALNKLLWKL